ncbi:hypothetical protein PENTCL1PPCAC_30545, partial [Pristionchus entomophagus]
YQVQCSTRVMAATSRSIRPRGRSNEIQRSPGDSQRAGPYLLVVACWRPLLGTLLQLRTPRTTLKSSPSLSIKPLVVSIIAVTASTPMPRLGLCTMHSLLVACYATSSLFSYHPKPWLTRSQFPSARID